MTIEKFISDKLKQVEDAAQDTETVTLRLASDTITLIDELSLTLDVTRQEVMAEFIKDSLAQALEHYEKIQNKADILDLSADSEDSSAPRYVLLNTNKRNDPNDHINMVSKGIAAAFYGDWKEKIDKLQKDDIVFLYESGVGIVGIGKASGNTEVLDKGADVGEVHQQKLVDYRRVKPLSAREIKKLTGTNMRFLQTMFNVKAPHGKLIEQALKVNN